MKANIELGDLVKDIVTGAEGIVMCRSDYLTGCTHMAIEQRKVKPDGSMPDWLHIDVRRLKLLKKNVIKLYLKAVDPGGPCVNPPKM